MRACVALRQPLPLPYTSQFWPRDFLTTNCTAVSVGPAPMPARFGGAFFDGQLAVAYNCTLAGGSMHVRPTVWLSPTSGTVMRFDVPEATPGWNPQTWDILQQVT